MSGGDGAGTIETIWRMESARIIGGLVRIVRDLDTTDQPSWNILGQSPNMPSCATWC